MRQPTLPGFGPMRPKHSEQYNWYIKHSDEWPRNRQTVLDRDGLSCRLCGEEAYTAHHLSYNQLDEEIHYGETGSLISICPSCHDRCSHPNPGLWIDEYLTVALFAARLYGPEWLSLMTWWDARDRMYSVSH